MRLAVPASLNESATVSAGVERRTLLRTGAVAAVIGLGAVLLGGAGRIVAGGTSAAAADAGPARSVSDASGSGSTRSGKPAGGVRIAQAANVPVGGVKAFTDPRNNAPSFLLQPKTGTFLAYSGVCTHQGCTVGFDQASNQFACPCHGARFDGSTGEVLRGPARRPLDRIDVVESNGVIYAV